MNALRNAEIKTYQDETSGEWHARAFNPRNGKPVIETNAGYETEEAAIKALIANYRRIISG